MTKIPTSSAATCTLRKQNGIGTDRGEIVITSAEQLKDEEIRLALAAAESDDVAVDQETGHVTILLRDTIDVEAAESVWVEARDNIYQGSRAPLYVRLLTSHQLDSVRIKGKEGLFDVSTESGAIYAGSAILEGGDGGIGEADRPFRIGLSAGGTLTARAAGDIYVRDVRTSINVAQVYSQGDVYLDAWGSIVPAGDSPLAIQGENIELVARVGGVGTSERPLVLQSGPSGRITASVASGRGIYINGIGGVVRSAPSRPPMKSP